MADQPSEVSSRPINLNDLPGVCTERRPVQCQLGTTMSPGKSRRQSWNRSKSGGVESTAFGLGGQLGHDGLGNTGVQHECPLHAAVIPPMSYGVGDGAAMAAS